MSSNKEEFEVGDRVIWRLNQYYVGTVKSLRINSISKSRYDYVDVKWDYNPHYLVNNRCDELEYFTLFKMKDYLYKNV